MSKLSKKTKRSAPKSNKRFQSRLLRSLRDKDDKATWQLQSKFAKALPLFSKKLAIPAETILIRMGFPTCSNPKHPLEVYKEVLQLEDAEFRLEKLSSDFRNEKQSKEFLLDGKKVRGYFTEEDSSDSQTTVYFIDRLYTNKNDRNNRKTNKNNETNALMVGEKKLCIDLTLTQY